MQTFSSDGVDIAFLDEGDRDHPAVLLIHGFASHSEANWVAPGWVRFLVEQGYRVISFDNRGHGQSEKLYDLEAYGAPLMAEDARRLLDHLNIQTTFVIGYSMGARIAAFLSIAHPGRVRGVVFVGLGFNMVRGMAGTGPIAKALEAERAEDVTNATARTFRDFAERTGSDLKALAACIRSSRAPITKDALGQISCPVLVAVGEKDVIGGAAQPLADLMVRAEAFVIPSADHMKAVGHKDLKARVKDFFETAIEEDDTRTSPGK